MADSWIKVEYGTIDKIEVAKIATALGMDPYTVLGRLIKIWSYFDVQSRDGRIEGIDTNFLDRLVQHPGFCGQLAAVGWMAIDDAGIRLPNFDRHNGGGAKARALRAQRNERYRGGKKNNVSKKDAARDAPPSHAASPEKSRGEETIEDQISPSGVGRDIQPTLPFVPIDPPKPRDDATALAEEFAFAGGEGTSPSAIARARAVMADLLAAGVTAPVIRAELARPGRHKSEHPGDLRRRLLPPTKGEKSAIDPFAGFRAAANGAG